MHDNGNENCNKNSKSITKAISTKVGLKETEESKACTRVIRKKSYELVRILWSYDVHPFEFAIRSDRGDLQMDIKSFEPF